MLSPLSRPSLQVIVFFCASSGPFNLDAFPDIYRIVSTKSLEQSADPIKAPTSDTIPVAIDSSTPAAGSKCC